MKKLETYYQFVDAKILGCYDTPVRGEVVGLHTDALVSTKVMRYEYPIPGTNRTLQLGSLYGSLCQGRPGEVLYPIQQEWPCMITGESWWVIGENGNLILCEKAAN